ncbi:hypothetical protein NE865_02218 [Phthorimaea operculella]|nr:hypothetical protein NE865_02218 [Phthorimaea operculella]
MESRDFSQGMDTHDSEGPVSSGTGFEDYKMMDPDSTLNPSLAMPGVMRGVETAKQKLRAFSIQKKALVPPVTVVKPVCTGNTTVLIGKLCNPKLIQKPEKPPGIEDKIPKPPKPGGSKKLSNESYTEIQKKTLSDIEDMKRKMELVELGIPLGLVCPSTNALPVKAMPTKAMPPIKTFLDNAKIDEIIREARKAKAEGKEFKFDYQKFVPDYDNPFQRKSKEQKERGDDSDDAETLDKKDGLKKSRRERDRRDKIIDRRKDRYDKRRDDRYRDKGRPRDKDKRRENRSKDRDEKSKDRDHKSRDKDDKHKKDDKSEKKDVKADVRKAKDDTRKDDKKEAPKKIEEKPAETQQDKDGKETDVDLKDFLVCDSWSLDAEGKNSPQVDDKLKKIAETKSKKELEKDVSIAIDPLEQLRQSLGKSKPASPKPKIEKLKPVVDAFEYEIDPNDDEVGDLFDEDSKDMSQKDNLYDSPVLIKYDVKKESSNDGMNEEAFLESVISEIKHENIYDDDSNDKGLVEYDESPSRDSKEPSIGSVTPDLDDSSRAHSQRSDYSDGRKSVDSRKSIESGYKSNDSVSKSDSQKSYSKFTSSSFKPIEPVESERFKSTFKSSEKTVTSSKSSESLGSEKALADTTRSKSSEGRQKSKPQAPERDEYSVERELDEALEAKMSRDTVNSLETWSFVLKICQPLLFRHDKNKCYKETRTTPKLWYTLNPKLCNCVTDRSIVYEELERCKMDHVDRLYSCDQIREPAQVVARTWYPRQEQCVLENPTPMRLSSEWDVDDEQTRHGGRDEGRTLTPGKDESLDMEYQKFMEAVSWSETSPPGPSSSGRSLTPTREHRKSKAVVAVADQEERKEAKKMKLSSEGWSQESEIEEEDRT